MISLDAPPNAVTPRVLVIGAGFGGIELCKALDDLPVLVDLVDRQNYHLFQPLLYQVATAALSPADIAYPIRRIFRHQANVRVYLAEAVSVDLREKRVNFTAGAVHYDYLVLAAGATHSYFGKDTWREEAPGLKSIDDATEIRKRILLAFEEAEYEADEESRRAKLTFVIVGGGPTGVELAGALKEIAVNTIPSDFRHVDTTTARIILLDAGDRLLSAMHPDLSKAAQSDLEKMGVEVRLNSRVTGVDELGVTLGDERLFAQNVFWAAGVQASPLARTLGVPLDKSGRVVVGPDLSIHDHPEVFVVGDMAAMFSGEAKTPVPGVAQGAIQAARYVAAAIADDVTKGRRAVTPFVYKDRGTMATIGRAKAVAEVGGYRFTGFIAWLLWSVVHVAVLVGFRNRIVVTMAWMWNYMLHARGARLITGKIGPSVKKFRGALPPEEPEELDEADVKHAAGH